VELIELLDRLQPDEEILRHARRRQAAVWRGEQPDVLPILVHGTLPDDLAALPRYNLKECWYDPEKMLWNAVLDMIAALEARSDAVPSMRANLGCGIMASVFGCRQEVFEDKMPWIVRHLSREEIEAADVRDASRRGDIPRVLEYMAYFVERLEGRAAVYCSDVQGPFDTAHLVYGDDLFTALYDDPAFVHALLEKVTDVYIEVVRAMKAVNGEPDDAAYHYNQLYVEGAGTRTSEDTTTLISAEHVEEFAVPYTARAFEPFGGYVHYCGDGATLRRPFMALDSVKGFNFGDPQMHDMRAVLREFIEAGKVYYGSFPRFEGEDLKRYFERVLDALDGARTGLIFSPRLTDADGDRRAVVDLWRSLQ